MPPPELGMTYAIYWRRYGVLKVGRARTMARIRELTSTGGEVIILMRDRAEVDERDALAAMRDRFPRAFTSEQSSVQVLPRGRGFTECFLVTTQQLAEAVRVIIKGTSTYGRRSPTNSAAGLLPRRAVDADARRPVPDGDRPVLPRRRPRPANHDRVEHPAVGIPVAIGPRRRPDRRDAARACGHGRHRDLHVRSTLVPVPVRVAFPKPSEAISIPRTAGRPPEVRWRPDGDLLGWGERGSERERERRREPRWTSSVTLLPHPPSRGHRSRLQALRHSPPLPRAMATRAPSIGRDQ